MFPSPAYIMGLPPFIIGYGTSFYVDKIRKDSGSPAEVSYEDRYPVNFSKATGRFISSSAR
jgi:hypothetical protein